MREAAITRSAADMSGVYAADAVHEFPFVRPGVPSRREGRDAIISFVNAFWSTSPLRYERYRTIAIHGTTDPDTIVVEQEVEGISSTTGPLSCRTSWSSQPGTAGSPMFAITPACPPSKQPPEAPSRSWDHLPRLDLTARAVLVPRAFPVHLSSRSAP